MANAYPTIYPSGFNGTYTDFNKAKIDRSGAVRVYTGSVTVPNGTVLGTLIGIVPVRKGAKVLTNASSLWFDALGTSVTTEVGVTYNTSSTQTSYPAQFVATGNTTAAAGGNVLLNGVEGGQTFVALDDGWLSVTTQATATTTVGNINFNVAIAYDYSALQ